MEFFWTNFIFISIGVVYLYSLISTLTVLLLENRSPIRSIAWIIVLVFMPVIGIFFYILLGQNLRQKKKIIKKRIRKLEPVKLYSDDSIEERINELDNDSLSLIQLLENGDDAYVYENTNIQILHTPKKTFDTIFEEIAKAEKYIHIEFYIIANDKVGHKLREALIVKAKEGLEIKIIYDFWGCFDLPKSFFHSLKKEGIQFQAFYPPRFPFLFSRINFRNHRKLIIIDGKIGFTGGVNMANRYLYGDHLGAWRDTMIRLEGSAVYGLQETFLCDWYFTSGEMLKNKSYFPEPDSFENNIIQIVESGPDKKFRTILFGMCQAIATAKEYIYIQTPYFMPPDEMLSAIQTAAIRGVDVRILIPTKSDISMAQSSNNSFIERLHEAGVRMYWYTNGFLHSKTMVIDDNISSIGTSNMDFRSFEQNFELNAFIFEKKTAIELKELFLNDIAVSKEVSPIEWRNRGKMERMKESLSRLFSPIM